jgi:hypothetical protein
LNLKATDGGFFTGKTRPKASILATDAQNGLATIAFTNPLVTHKITWRVFC